MDHILQLDSSQIVVPAVVGAVITLVIPLILRQSWPRQARFAAAVLITVLTGTAVILAWLKPDSWQGIAAGLSAAVVSTIRQVD